jgi:hypothetical protein
MCIAIILRYRLAYAPFNFVLEEAFRFTNISYRANTGTVSDDGEYNTSCLFPDFTVNSVLWVKVVSEDSSTTRHYKFRMKTILLCKGFVLELCTTKPPRLKTSLLRSFWRTCHG